MRIVPTYFLFLAAAVTFVVLVYLEGWIWPLKYVGAMLPVAGYLIFA